MAAGLASRFQVAVCGLHLRGQKLNWQLTDLDATFVKACRSSPQYKLYAVKDLKAGITKPGMVYVKAGGAAIELEVWEMPTEKFGYFMQYIKAPLGIGTVWLDDGSWVYGFICEGFVAQSGEGVEDVTHTGGWLNYLAGKEAQ